MPKRWQVEKLGKIMIQIKPIPIGIQKTEATNLLVSVAIPNTQDKTCQIGWRLLSEDLKNLETGTINLTEEQYAGWGEDNTYLEDIVLKELELVRL